MVCTNNSTVAHLLSLWSTSMIEYVIRIDDSKNKIEKLVGMINSK